jgi:dUTP pyrophosphatase
MFRAPPKFELLSKDAHAPTRGTSGSAGLDFYTPINVIVPKRGDALIPLDIALKLHMGSVMIMKEKSGLAVKKKITIGASVIDSDYRGNIHAHLINNSDKPVLFKAGQKVCQGIIVNCFCEDLMESEVSKDTERGEGGFGSTGK